VVRHGPHAGQHLVRGHQLVAPLHQVGEDLRDVLLLAGDVALQVGVEGQQQQPVVRQHARDEVHLQQPHLKALVRLLERGEGPFGQPLGVVQQVDGREQRLGGTLPRLLGQPPPAVPRLLLLHVPRALGGLLGVLVGLHLLRLVQGAGRVVVRDLPVDAQEEIHRQHHELGHGRGDALGYGVHGAGVGPNAPAVELHQHLQALLGRDLARLGADHLVQEALELPVKCFILFLQVDHFDVCNDMIEQKLPEILVIAPEELET